jgi:hypothetical protein
MDFGVLGAPGISGLWSDEDIKLHILNIHKMLEDNGLFVLKLDCGYFESNKINLDNYIFPFFRPTTFKKFSPCVHIKNNSNRRPDFTKRDQYKFYFLKKI